MIRLKCARSRLRLNSSAIDALKSLCSTFFALQVIWTRVMRLNPPMIRLKLTWQSICARIIPGPESAWIAAVYDQDQLRSK